MLLFSRRRRHDYYGSNRRVVLVVCTEVVVVERLLYYYSLPDTVLGKVAAVAPVIIYIVLILLLLLLLLLLFIYSTIIIKNCRCVRDGAFSLDERHYQQHRNVWYQYRSCASYIQHFKWLQCTSISYDIYFSFRSNFFFPDRLLLPRAPVVRVSGTRPLDVCDRTGSTTLFLVAFIRF